MPFTPPILMPLFGLQLADSPVGGVMLVDRDIVPVKPPVAFIWTRLAPPCPEGTFTAGDPALQRPAVIQVEVG